MGEDNLSTWKAFEAMGVTIKQTGPDALEISGVGVDGLAEPGDVIDCGNSGTTMRLMSGLLAGQSFFSVLTGDKYLRNRPMKRVVTPLTAMGARIWGRDGGERAPLAIQEAHLTQSATPRRFPAHRSSQQSCWPGCPWTETPL